MGRMLGWVKDQGPRSPTHSAAESPTPGKVAATSGLAPKGVAPRAPSAAKSTSENTEPGGYQSAKGVAPRAPSADRPNGVSEGDVRTLAQAIAKELLKPIEHSLAGLEVRIAQLERTLDRTERALDSADASGQVQALVAPVIPVPAVFTPVAPVVAVKPPIANPPPKNLDEPAPRARVLEPRPLPKPIALDDVHLSSDELGMFDSAKRMRRIATFFVLLLLLAGGGLVTAMIVSRSGG
jgi:hypothetical protein